MKELEQKALDLIDKHLPNVRGADRYNYNLEQMNVFIAKQHAIKSVTHTIEVLEGSNIQADNQERLINSLINEQIELKKILEGRL
jgi:hypothetical protein